MTQFVHFCLHQPKPFWFNGAVWSWWWQRSQWPNVAAARHQAKDSTTLGSWRQPVPSTSPVRSSRSRSRPCASSPSSHRSSSEEVKRLGSSCPGQTRGEFGSSWGAFGFHGTVRGTLPATIPECRSRFEGGLDAQRSRDGEHDCKGQQFGTEFEQVQPIAVRPVSRVDASTVCGHSGG